MAFFSFTLSQLWFNTYSNDDPGNPAMQNLLEALLDRPGFGTKCMDTEDEDNNST